MNGAFDRLSSKRREKIETSILQDLEKIHPNKSDFISVASLGLVVSCKILCL